MGKTRRDRDGRAAATAEWAGPGSRGGNAATRQRCGMARVAGQAVRRRVATAAAQQAEPCRF